MKQTRSSLKITLLYICLLSSVWAFMAWFYRSADVLSHPPGHIHAWRQSDCASLTRNFYEEDLPIWEPRVHYAKEDGSGKAAGEFPVLNYFTAKVMKITGYSWSAQRGILLAFSWLAMIGLFLWLRKEFAQSMLAWLLPLLLFTSPIFAYYACNYLPDVPSAALALCGLAADAYFRKDKKIGYGILAAFLLCLATLMKISSGVFWVAVLCLLLLQFWPFSGFRAAWRKNWPLLAVHMGLFLLTAGWYRYANHYDMDRSPMIFLTEMRPYWEVNAADVKVINHEIFDRWLNDYFELHVWYAAGIAFVLNFWLTRKNKFLFWLNIAVPLGFFAFLMLMYKQLYFHDYYLVIPIVTPVVVIGICVASLWENATSRLPQFLLFVGLAWFIADNAQHTRKVLVNRYFELQYNDFPSYDLLTLQPMLREKGVDRTELMTVLPDVSPNNSLVLVDQYGYTNFVGTNGSEEDIQRHIDMGVRWLTVTDTAYLRNDFLRPFTGDTFMVYNQIHVFRLKR